VRETKAELVERLETLEAENALLREKAEYWAGYAEEVEGKLLRAYDRLSAYDEREIAKLHREVVSSDV